MKLILKNINKTRKVEFSIFDNTYAGGTRPNSDLAPQPQLRVTE